MNKCVLSAIIVSIAIVIFGVLLKCGIDGFSNRDKVVNVKGLAIKEVKADWSQSVIGISHKGDDKTKLVDEITEMQDELVSYLKTKGIDDGELLKLGMNIWENSEEYRNNKWVAPSDKYSASADIVITTEKIDLVVALREVFEREILGINKKDMRIAFNGYPRYEFKALNDIKPAMIEEATRNAREAADKFADDSNSEIAGIKTATQGLFSVYADDDYMPYMKTVRVVTSVSFELK